MISWKGEAFFRSTLLAYQFDIIEFHAFMDNNVLSAFILYFVVYFSLPSTLEITQDFDVIAIKQLL